MRPHSTRRPSCLLALSLAVAVFVVTPAVGQTQAATRDANCPLVSPNVMVNLVKRPVFHDEARQERQHAVYQRAVTEWERWNAAVGRGKYEAILHVGGFQDQKPDAPDIACRAHTDVSLFVSLTDVRLAWSIADRARREGWARRNESLTPEAALLRTLPRTLGIPNENVLVSADGRFVDLRPRQAERAITLDTTAQLALPRSARARIALPMLSPRDTVEVTVHSTGVLIQHTRASAHGGFTEVRSHQDWSSANGAIRSWTPVGMDSASYPVLSWGWVPTRDTLVLTASLSNVGTTRALRARAKRKL